MKKILGLDLGTNSIGWAVVNFDQDENENEVFSGISNADSRIIPMDQATIGDFNRGNSKSQTAERTRCRGVRRLYERGHLRRERLNRVLAVMGWLPEHYKNSIDAYGKLLPGTEPKLAWRKADDGKYEFLFKDAFNEMLEDFRRTNPALLDGGKKVPYDWTLYYLRRKALSMPVSNLELAWILLSFNQKRGYYQLRGEDEESTSGKKEDYYSLRVLEIIDTGEKKGNDKQFEIVLENGYRYRRYFRNVPDWIGKEKDFIITTDIDGKGNPKKDKEGKIKYSIRLPKDDDWTLLKKKTEKDINVSHKTVGEFIYDVLLSSPAIKIRGNVVRTIDRHFYMEELERIIDCQMRTNSDLQSKSLYKLCIESLYPSNEAYRNSIAGRDFKYLFINDILFYQRPLKSKKSLINDCPFEDRHYYDRYSGETKVSHIKCIAKSNPYFQEFRLWQFISNLRIFEIEHNCGASIKENVDVTRDFIPDNNSLADLFCWLNDKKEISQKEFFSYPGFNLTNNKSRERYRWNYVEDKPYPANETRSGILMSLNKSGVPEAFLTEEVEYQLWHLLYSVEDNDEFLKALNSFALKHNLTNEFVSVFSKHIPYKKEYGAYSEKAIRKLLSVMRAGRYWDGNKIDASTKGRIEKLISGEYDEKIRERIREKTIALRSVSDFQGLPLWLASYVVYDRHSEAKEIDKWSTPGDIDRYLQRFKQHSLRNPIVESVIMETLRTVRDIWIAEGKIDEIHIELGREMKNPADKRRMITERIQKNENANLRIRAMLTEFLNPEFNVENVRPNSPGQQEMLRIYEDSVLESAEIPDDVQVILDKFSKAEPQKRPTSSEVLRYKVWLEQKYRSPYTGQIIPLGKLFTSAYEIEHIIPQSLYFDDSYSNKVICESEVNKLKDNSLGYQFIKEHHGEIVTLSGGGQVKILEIEAYEKFVKENYNTKESSAKRRNLLAEELPEGFIQRQLNDSRYISRVVKTLLSNVVREEGEEEDISKNVITCTGAVTDRLKRDWGLKDVWKDIVLPRFERLDDMVADETYVVVNGNGKRIPVVPFHRQKGFDLKRIDHRHHAMDAIVIACATRNVVNYLNNSSACGHSPVKRYDLQRIVCEKRHQDDSGNYKWVIKSPSLNFVGEVKSTLLNAIVSFKNNVRIINKSTNCYERIECGKKVRIKQSKGDCWAIRKSMHKDTVFGEVDLRMKKTVSLNDALKNPQRIVNKDIKALISHCLSIKEMKCLIKDKFPDINRLEVYYFASENDNDRYYATRVPVTPEFTEKVIEKITDTGIRKIMKKHLEQSGNDPEVAFSPEGIERMNANIVELNNGKPHKPIYKVRKYEKADKFAIGEVGSKSKKFVEADKGTNLFFGVYASKEGERSYASIPLIDVINREKAGMTPVPEVYKESVLLFYLSPNDLVYVPTEEDQERGYVDDNLDNSRIYKMVSCTGNECYFVPINVAKCIVEKREFLSLIKMEKAITGEVIKRICVPLKVDRLGRIVKFNRKLR